MRLPAETVEPMARVWKDEETVKPYGRIWDYLQKLLNLQLEFEKMKKLLNLMVEFETTCRNCWTYSSSLKRWRKTVEPYDDNGVHGGDNDDDDDEDDDDDDDSGNSNFDPVFYWIWSCLYLTQLLLRDLASQPSPL